MNSKQNSLVRSHLYQKTNHTINYVARHTSCSRGWLRVVVQTIFGVITVTSFILIIIMALQRSPQKKRTCYITSCKVTCSGSNYCDSDIVSTVLEAEMSCKKIKLVLEYPHFRNRTLPSNWLTGLPCSIDHLSILGGNLRHISDDAFINPFAGNLKTLLLEDIKISRWTDNTLAGLSTLETLLIRNSTITFINGNALKAVRDTIQFVIITGSGRWNPRMVTGTNNLTELATVNFQNNDFGSILGPASFTGLEFCENLYLNSCNITAIALGAFDPLKNIKILFLNDNMLITVPTGLFNNIFQIQTGVKTRIHLQNNRWYCDCFQNDILLLSEKNMLLVDPLCYYPEDWQGTTFSDLENYCDIHDNKNIPSEKIDNMIEFQPLNKCHYGSNFIADFSLQLVSPLPLFRCHVTDLRIFNRASFQNLNENLDSSWTKSVFIVVHRSFSMMQVDTALNYTGFGLIWYHSACPNEVYCLNITPNIFRMYDLNFNTKYTFCPIDLHIAAIATEKCVSYNLSDNFAYDKNEEYNTYIRKPILYIGVGLICLFIGAVIVYGIIRAHPHLLKGSKRLLFVKHRSVDALVLPPKVPLRNSFDRQEHVPAWRQNIFIVSHDQQLLCPGSFVRSNSVRSDKSSSPTYISALQPTEAQLAEWRIRNHFDKTASITTIGSDLYDCDNNIYDNIAYESLK